LTAEPPSQPPRRGRPARLSRAAVTDAARAIVERDGIEALTMRRVARELGSSPMAIYRHVRDKDELLILLLDRLAMELPRPQFSADPRERAHQACRFMRDSLAEYEWIIDVLAQGDLIAPAILWLLEEIVAALMACGLSGPQAADGYRAVWQFTVGELTIRRGLERTAALGRPPFVVQVLTGVDPRELPALASLSPYWAPARGRDAYDIGLRALLDGLLSGVAWENPGP
jgi:AcrR family transcriptional regulator